MVATHTDYDNISNDYVDDIAIKLVSTLDRNDLVHILLDMVEPRIMLQNILITEQEQQKLKEEVGSDYHKVVCYECKGIQNKLQEILHNFSISTEDIVGK